MFALNVHYCEPQASSPILSTSLYVMRALMAQFYRCERMHDLLKDQTSGEGM